MYMVTASHFGGNIVLTRDSVESGSPFREVLKEVSFSNFRYPGGGVTEDQTWENGGLQRMFGEPMDREDENYVMTIREAFEFARETDTSLTIVVPSQQFLDRDSGTFRHDAFDRYIGELERVLSEYPDVKIRDFEIGNEFWGSKMFGPMTPKQYGMVANAEIRPLHEMAERITDQHEGWETPGIGIQAGAAWREDGPDESRDIASMISPGNRALVDTIFQHSYPNLDRNHTEWQQDWAVDPMKEFREIKGFREDLKLSVSEYNVTGHTATGVDQAAAWIEEFSGHIDKGVDEYQHWGISYEWLSNKFYDTRFPPGEADGGDIVVKATPLGQVYDLAESNLIGKSTMSDEDASAKLDIPESFEVTGFRDAGQRVIFLHNQGDEDGKIDLAEIPEGWHVAVHHLKDADSPYSKWYDESIPEPPENGEIADARGDMNVTSGEAAPDDVTLAPGEMAVLVMSEPGRDLTIEGAHNVTDESAGMVEDEIVGGEGRDILRGHVGDDTLDGGGGRNVLSGGKGDDLLKAGDEGDVIFADGGDDTVKGGDGDDVILATGRNDDDRAEIETGRGSDLVYAMSDQEVVISDFSDDDMLGLGGTFESGDELRDASRVVDSDLLIDLPNGGLVRLSGGAGRLETLQDNVLDFAGKHDAEPGVEYASTASGGSPDADFFDGLTYEQVIEIYDGVGAATAEDGGDFDLSWEEIEATLDRLELSPAQYAGYDPDAEDPWRPRSNPGKPDPSNPNPKPEHPDSHPEHPDPGTPEDPSDPDIPIRLPDPEDDRQPDDEDEQNPEDASGGACFVATAAYGNRMHPDVVALRHFRDRHLVRFHAGRAFVRTYWIVGPRLAKVTRPEQFHGRIARYVLSHLVVVLGRCGLT